MTLSDLSRKRLVGVHPDLVRVITFAAEGSPLHFVVTDGVRTLDRQKELVLKGASRTMRSLHLPQGDGFSHAVDLAVVEDGVARWDWPTYKLLASVVKAAAVACCVVIEWGGECFGTTLRDGPHFQLPRRAA